MIARVFAPARPGRRAGACGALLALATVASTSAAQDVMQVGADTHRVLLENAHVRVLAVRIPPGGRVPTHAHPANVAYFLAAATVRVTGADGRSVLVDIRPGTVQWNAPVTHSVENVGKTEFAEMQVELKDAAAAP